MGLEKFGASGTFLNIADGKIVRSHKQEVKDVTVSRINKLGKQVHEEKFDSITGYIKNLTTKDEGKFDNSKQYVIEMESNGEKFFISMPYSSRYSNSFLKALPNVDLSKPVKLMPWSMVDKNDASKKITGITMWQGADFKDKILPHYTKETPHGLPQMTKVMFKGKAQWDSTDMDAFLEKESMKLFMRVSYPDGGLVPASNESSFKNVMNSTGTLRSEAKTPF